MPADEFRLLQTDRCLAGGESALQLSCSRRADGSSLSPSCSPLPCPRRIYASSSASPCQVVRGGGTPAWLRGPFAPHAAPHGSGTGAGRPTQGRPSTRRTDSAPSGRLTTSYRRSWRYQKIIEVHILILSNYHLSSYIFWYRYIYIQCFRNTLAVCCYRKANRCIQSTASPNLKRNC